MIVQKMNTCIPHTMNTVFVSHKMIMKTGEHASKEGSSNFYMSDTLLGILLG